MSGMTDMDVDGWLMDAECNWLVDIGLIETAQIMFPDYTSFYTDNYIDYMAKYWTQKNGTI